MKKVVLAFSGGIGTTACLDLLRRRQGAEVITFTANLGQRASTEQLSDYALDIGASRSLVKDLRERFVSQFIRPALRAGAVFQSGYALSSALARPLIVSEVVRIAREVGAEAIAHGCAATSNDQIRFETSAAALAPDLQVISPLRTANLFTYEQIRAYLERSPSPWKESVEVFSITENLWGTTFEWSHEPHSFETVPESHFRLTASAEEAPNQPEEIRVGFERGFPTSLNGEPLAGVELLERLGALAAGHGVGRVDTFEDRMIGLKTRDIYEQPAATVLHTAKEALERLVLSRDLLLIKPQLSQKYAQLVYDGSWYSELRQAFDAFFLEAVEYVNGEVRLQLYKGLARVIGVRSANSLYNLEHDDPPDTAEQDPSSVSGFVRAMSRPIRVQSERQHPLWSQELL